ncbi:hypothetical protein [Flagellimonas allohymeniacidonis]|uniref:DUF4412 domain-containing protein n=1 Tax=Flagellimonas allohymeniacidonis TaxID=2517819 RepID=A0A4Q8QDG4_9FLAO|nr:hypothetical protein [Allomuricauda hymeniacidonis]TAI47138.1 hypothetical protein EW142_10635 [Allomuricauda hymeniacidonis]
MVVRLWLRTFFLLGFFCHSQEYFEGELLYKIEYETLNKNISAEYMAKEFGDSFTAFVKEDRYTMIYNGSGSNGWMKIIVRLDEGYSYTEYEKLDTIAKTKFAPETSPLLLFERNHKEKKEVMGELCESVTINVLPGEDMSFVKEIRGTHYFSPKYRLNPEKYKEYGNGYWNDYVKESGAISIRNETEYQPFFISTSVAVNIEEMKLDDSLFEPNPNKPIRLE